jgi:menaquinone-specific isochorismate synthase
MLPRDIQSIRSLVESRFRTLQRRLNERIRELPLSVSLDVDAVDLMAWLQCNPVYPRVHWASRDGELELSACGAAISVIASDEASVERAYSRIDETLRLCEDDSVAFLGGQAFDRASYADSLWSDFAILRFVLPEVLVMRRGDRFSLTAAVLVNADDTPESILSRMQHVLSGVDHPSGSGLQDQNVELISRIDLPDFDGWCTAIDGSLGAIERDEIEKVVMARRTDLTLSERIDPVRLLARLKRTGKNCFAFMFEPVDGTALVGATPERLFRLEHDRIKSEAVSGTAVDNSSGVKGDNTGEMELLSDEKNLREHGFVLRYVAEKLSELCESVDRPSPRALLNLGNVSHIYSKISGRLRKGISLYDVVANLHPTPAVCGTAPEKALRLITELEPFARGWYAGPIGIIAHSFSEMAVTIRSSIVSGNKVSVFAGSGIVRGSTARNEWRELEHKIAPALEVLGGVSA